MAGARDVDRVQVARLDLPVEVRVDEVQARRGAPVAEQPRLDVLVAQRLAHQRVVEQIDLPHGEVVGGTPVGVDQVKVATGKRPRLAIGHCRPLSVFGSASILRPFPHWPHCLVARMGRWSHRPRVEGTWDGYDATARVAPRAASAGGPDVA